MSNAKSFDLRKALQMGLVGGLIGVLIALVGMVEEFSGRDIVAGVITMGQTLLVLALTFTAFAAARATGARSPVSLLTGALTGAISGGVLALLSLAVETLDLRGILVNASPSLVEILTFGKDLGPGLGLLVLAGAIIGALGGLIYWLPDRVRQAFVAGLTSVALLGLLQDLIQVSLSKFEAIHDAIEWMFGRGVESGLSPAGALVVFIVSAGGNYLWSTNSTAIQHRFSAMPSKSQRSLLWLGYGMLALFVIYLPIVVGLYLSEVINVTGLFILMGLGLNIVVGFAGLLDLGYVAFYAIGAYTVGVLSNLSGELVMSLGWDFWLALPIAIFIATLAGIVLGIPVLNVRGDYLAIVTLGFGEIIRILALSDFLKPLIGGSQGIVNIPPASVAAVAVDNAQRLYYLIVAGCLLAFFIARRLRDSRLGRSWKAMREDEDVAQAMGINLVTTKLLAFATGAAFSGLSGAILAVKLGTIYPHSFSLLISINVLSLIIVGGMGSIPGVFIGALLLAGMPELLREFAEYRLLIYGALLVVMMQVRPEGFWPETTHKRELHETSPVDEALAA